MSQVLRVPGVLQVKLGTKDLRVILDFQDQEAHQELLGNPEEMVHKVTQVMLALEVTPAPQDQRVILAELDSAILDQEDLRVTGGIKVHLDQEEAEEIVDQRVIQALRELQESLENPDPQENLDQEGSKEVQEEMVIPAQKEILVLLNVMS